MKMKTQRSSCQGDVSMGNLRFYSEIPSFSHVDPSLIDKVAILSEKYGFYGSLIFYSHQTFDPLALAIRIIERTTTLIPIIAVQPYAITPIGISKFVNTVPYIYQRKVGLNLITGVNEKELNACGESIDPRIKYQRLAEYIYAIQHLIFSGTPLTLNGGFYRYSNVRIHPLLPSEYTPKLFIAGSSEESFRIARKIGATSLIRPEPVDLFAKRYANSRLYDLARVAIRVSVIARPTAGEAWNVARSRFQQTRTGEITLQLRRRVLSDNTRLMANLAHEKELHDQVYWMGAYLSGKTVDPYLVGSYEEIALYLKRYVELGVEDIFLGDLFDESRFDDVALVRTRLSKLI